MSLIVKKSYYWVACFSIASLLVTGCSSMSKQPAGPSEAEIAEKNRVEKQRMQVVNEKAAKEKAAKEKAAAKKQAVEAEDSIQMQNIKKIDVSAAETLPEESISETASADSKDMSIVAAAPLLNTPMPDMQMQNASAVSTAPNTYRITVNQKNRQHPYFGKGDKRGFLVNGVPGNYVIAKKGETITFEVRTGVQHDFYVTSAPNGWGAAPFTSGVEGQFTYRGDVTFKPTANTPADLYYGCRNHNAMGGRIVTVDANADIASVKQKLDAERKLAEKNAQSIKNKGVDPQKVRQKIAYVAMLMQFKGKTLIPEHKAKIETKIAAAKDLEKKGQLAEALAIAQQAADLFKQKAAQSGPSKEEIAEHKEELNDLMITLEAFIDSHKASYDQMMKQNSSKVVDYDHDLVEKLVTEAVAVSEKDDFTGAKNRVKKAERLVTKALNDMLNSQTIVYDLNFDSKLAEYNYEVKKYESYLELIPVAIEVKKPGKGSIKLMESYVKKGKFFKEKADDAAKAERWEEAFVVIRDATIETRRGLRLLGVSM